ncbi:acetylglutamate kinase [Nannocystaceae bacterium ST9]
MLKFGGEVVADPAQLREVLGEVASLVAEGWRFVLCHGGGPQVSAMMERLGLDPIKIAGQRITDAPTLALVASEIAGRVASEVVAAAWACGLPALGVSAGVIHARRRPPVAVASEGGREVDYGLVGDVTAILEQPLAACWSAGLTPVVNPLGIEPSTGERFNINADTVAAAIAVALGADHLFLLTAVPGVLADRDEPGSRIPRLHADEAVAAIAAGTIVGGMIPKVEEALAALAGTLLAEGRGVGAVHILASAPGVVRAEAREPGSRGTVLLGPRGPVIE